MLLGAAFAASPLSGAIGAHPRVSVVAGIVLGVAVFTIRRLRSRRRWYPHGAEAPLFQTVTSTPLVLLLLGGIAIAFLLTAWWLLGQYTEAIWRNAHGIFVPIIMVVLARPLLRRDES